MAGPARQAQTLWILGDLYEYWAGDDDLEADFNAQIAAEITSLVQAGVTVRIIVGNRDFLLSKGFTERTGAVIEADTVSLDLNGERTIVTHGDALCTDDTAYQQFRGMVRNLAWQAQFLTQPLAVRRQIAEQLRMQSEANKGGKTAALMDTNPQAVATLLTMHGATCLIHGHTHMPARHTLEVEGRQCVRWVLADWHEKATWLESGPDGLVARTEN